MSSRYESSVPLLISLSSDRNPTAHHSLKLVTHPMDTLKSTEIEHALPEFTLAEVNFKSPSSSHFLHNYFIIITFIRVLQCFYYFTFPTK